MKRRVTYTDTHDEAEFEYSFVPIDGTQLYHREGDTLVVAYLAQHDCPSNPMKEYDGQGELITYREDVITDGEPWANLGLNGEGYRDELDRDLDSETVYKKTREMLASLIKQDFSADFVRIMLEREAGLHEALDQIYDKWAGIWSYGAWEWNDLDREFFANLPEWEDIAKKAWDEAHDEGKIGTYLAVPVNYCGSNHGPGTTSIHTCSIEDANAVWIPDQSCIDNMNFDGCVTYKDKLAVADKYAASVLDEYEKWCNGEVYGCVVETFVLENEMWKQAEEDSCWGFIGYEWAEKSLEEEFFRPAIKHSLKGIVCETS